MLCRARVTSGFALVGDGVKGVGEGCDGSEAGLAKVMTKRVIDCA